MSRPAYQVKLSVWQSVVCLVRGWVIVDAARLTPQFAVKPFERPELEADPGPVPNYYQVGPDLYRSCCQTKVGFGHKPDCARRFDLWISQPG